MDILADVQEDDERALVADLGQPLAESGHATGVMAFQVM
jgi:hypothetical protein